MNLFERNRPKWFIRRKNIQQTGEYRFDAPSASAIGWAT
jgi:hypothetical protein